MEAERWALKSLALLQSLNRLMSRNDAASFEFGKIVARGAGEALNQRFLVALVMRLKRDRGDDHKDALLPSIVGSRGPHFGGPGEGMRECH